jgi:hypothetical protein
MMAPIAGTAISIISSKLIERLRMNFLKRTIHGAIAPAVVPTSMIKSAKSLVTVRQIVYQKRSNSL